MELIELAKANDVHLLCLPLYTTHILQPLDVVVLKSFKSHFSKAYNKYLAKHPGVLVMPDMLASLVAEAWPSSFTAVKIKTWTVSFKDVEKETSSTDSDSTTCPLCGMVFADDDTSDF